jgi:hypothetical protein
MVFDLNKTTAKKGWALSNIIALHERNGLKRCTQNVCACELQGEKESIVTRAGHAMHEHCAHVYRTCMLLCTYGSKLTICLLAHCHIYVHIWQAS